MPFQVHEVAEHLLDSHRVAQTYRIKVWRPMSNTDDSERFPVLYATDSDEFFGGLASLAAALQVHGEAPRFILVGIGYKESRAAGLLRMRDFFSHSDRALFEWEIRQLAESALVDGVRDLQAIMQTTDASDYLGFVRDELLPFINQRYPTRPDENSYFGYSAGGGFGLYTLFTKPDTFGRYILGSPSTSYSGRNFAMRLAESFLAAGSGLAAKVFMSVGELEEFKSGHERFDLVSGYYHLAKFLKSASIPGLDLKTRVFAGETHATAWSMAFTHGVQQLFGPAGQVPFLPDFLK
jgi:uncharacterized protein